MSQVLVKVTGADYPGITAALTHILAQHETDLCDIEQVVVKGQLILCFLIDLEEGTTHCDAVLKDLLFTAKKMGQDLEFKILDDHSGENSDVPKQRHVVTMMGDYVSSAAVERLARTLANENINIDSIRRLSDHGLQSLEILIALDAGGAVRLKQVLLTQMAGTGVDIAIQREALMRCSKRLVALDMDSTLISIELIDELARLHGVFDQVSQVTHRAMAGELDFSESLRLRAQLLKGVDQNLLDGVVNQLPLSNGAEVLIGTLKNLGYQVGIISGGFSAAAHHLKDKLGLDFAHANDLEIKSGKLTGKIAGPIIDAQGKADLLIQAASKARIPLAQTVAIGDGANDALMLANAGLGVAFYGKPKLKASAHASVSSGGLERILYLLGMTGQEIKLVAGGGFEPPTSGL